MNDLFVINSTKDKINPRHQIYYTIIGHHSSKDEDGFPLTEKLDIALAKKMTNTDGHDRYFIKIGTYGRPYDPIGMYSENNNNRFLTRAGKKMFDFKEVNEKVFNYYINFLKTKNKAWLNNTEREMQ